MAKKKGSGSNLGLIITLVFFVLSTVILGVTTYMGFSAQEEKDKTFKKMTEEKTQAEKDAKWYRAVARILRAYQSGPPAGVDAAEVAGELKQINAGAFDAASNQKDKDEVSKYIQTLNARSPWDPNRGTAPSRTFDQVLTQQAQEIEAWKARTKKAEDAARNEQRQREEAEAEHAKAQAAMKMAMETARTKALEDRKFDLNRIGEQQEALTKENKERNDGRFKQEELEKDLAKQLAKVKKLEGDLAEKTKELRRVTDERDEKQTRLAQLYEKTGQDPRAIEAAVLDARATQALRNWTRDWQIVDIDRKGSMPYINLGSVDRISPQVTFSIHSVGLDGKLSPVPKGTMEVVRVIGSHLSQARITSVKDPQKDPILKGDRLFNPTWDPNRKKRVAIAGLADLGGDGIDSTDDLRKLLRRQNVEIDAYIDLKDNAAPKIDGKGVTVNTDYLILGDNLDAVNHPKARDQKYREAFDKLVRDMQTKANANGVTVIGLQKYLDMIGYKAPKLVKPTPQYGFTR